MSNLSAALKPVLELVSTIVMTAKTGTIGDGKLFIIPVSRAVWIRTGKENATA